MIDKELLELAAKAAEYKFSVLGGVDVITKEDGFTEVWKPISDSGHALDLAVRLNMRVDVQWKGARTVVLIDGVSRDVVVTECWEEWRDDACMATRYAIVRAAAEVGKAMK